MENNKNETAIIVTVGETKIKAVLNNSKTAKDLISKLPYTIRLNRYEYDYCGTVDESLQFDEKDKHNCWINGEIAYVGNYFSILFDGEEQSQGYSDMITIGHIKDDLKLMKELGYQIEVTVSLV
jgi:hypothetical protein